MKIPDYRPDVEAPPLAEDELAALDELLTSLPGSDAMNVEMLDGYLTALLVAPTPVQHLSSERWMPPIWGGDSPGRTQGPFTSSRQRKRVVVDVLRHLHAIDLALREGGDSWEPVFSVAESADGQQWADAEDWCIGFLQGCALDAEGWGPVFDDPELGALLQPLVRLGAEPEAAGAAPPADDIAERDACSRAVPDAVLALHRRRR